MTGTIDATSGGCAGDFLDDGIRIAAGLDPLAGPGNRKEETP